MCDHCHQNPCAAACPTNTDEDFGICEICGNPIDFCDEYVELTHEVVHLECLIDKFDSDPREALELLGAELFTAGK